MEIDVKAIIILIVIVGSLPLYSMNQKQLSLCTPPFDSQHEIQELRTHSFTANESTNSNPLRKNLSLNPSERIHSTINTTSDDDSYSDTWEVCNSFDPNSPQIRLLQYFTYFHHYLFFASVSVIITWGIFGRYKTALEVKKRRFLLGWTVSKGFWLKLLIMFGILVIFPTEAYFWEEYGQVPSNSNFSINSVLVSFASWYGYTYVTPITLFAALVITLPAIYMNRRLRNLPADSPITDLGLATTLATVVLTYYWAEYFPPGEISWLLLSSPSIGLLNFGTLVIIVLILLPIFRREACLWGKEEESDEKSATKAGFLATSRYSIIGCLWGLAAFVLPLVAIVQFRNPETFILRYDSPSFVYRYIINNTQIGGMENRFYVIPVFDFVNFLIVSVFQIIFAFHVLRYLRGIASRRLVMQLGLLSIVVPITYFIVIGANPEVGVLYAIPIPIVLIIGLAALAFITPNVPRLEVERPEGMLRYVVPEASSERPTDDLRVQVPLIYYLKIKLMRLLRRES